MENKKKNYILYKNGETEKGERALVEIVDDFEFVILKSDEKGDENSEKIDAMLLALKYLTIEYTLHKKEVNSTDNIFNWLCFQPKETKND